MTGEISYRREIDGLRAIAVVAVVLYHAKFVVLGVEWFEGGFIGVDIFFVISGYLITRLILTEHWYRGSFSFSNFYERRARRILPMLLITILVSVPFAWTRLSPAALIEYSQSVLSALFFGSNIFFYANTTAYGADSSLLKPFLHTWSLGVEEQFYLLFPILLIGFSRLTKRRSIALPVMLVALSLVSAELIGRRDPDANFFLPFGRFWELSLGAVVAFRELSQNPLPRKSVQEIFSSIGLCLILISVFTFDSKTPHPGIFTVLPVFGTALLLHFGSNRTLVGRFLGWPPLVLVGLWSYSIYLWHYPVFAFERLGTENLANLEKVGLVVITIALASFSYVFIEEPFRRRLSRKTFLVFLLLSFVALASFSTVVIQKGGMPTERRLGHAVDIFAELQRKNLFGDKGCGDSPSVRLDDSKFCLIGDLNQPRLDFLLLGDSHSMVAQTLFDRLGKELGLRGAWGGSSGCLPLLEVFSVRGNPHPNKDSKRCFNFVEDGYQLVNQGSIPIVFLLARWNMYLDGTKKISDLSLIPKGGEDAHDVYKKGAQFTVRKFSELGTKLVVMLQIPKQITDVKRVIEDLIASSAISSFRDRLAKFRNDGVPLSDHLARQSAASSAWFELLNTEKYERLILLDPTDDFCEGEEAVGKIERYRRYVDSYDDLARAYAVHKLDGGYLAKGEWGLEHYSRYGEQESRQLPERRCPYVMGETLLYSDDNHASEAGFFRLERKFRSVLSAL